MKNHLPTFLLLLALGVSGWATAETFRLWDATQQVAASQVTEMQATAKLAAAKARQASHLANVDGSAGGGGARK